jgi:hypothetical protein
MRFWSLLPIITALHNVADVTATSVRLLTRSDTPASILTPDFVDVVQKVVNKYEIPGLTLAVVFENGSSELGAWGIKSEDGTNMTTDVRKILEGSERADETTMHL